jgi:hypothetical protein
MSASLGGVAARWRVCSYSNLRHGLSEVFTLLVLIHLDEICFVELVCQNFGDVAARIVECDVPNASI